MHTLVTLPPQSRRRYGGYIVHLGIVLMFIGFTGKSWTVDRETSMTPGQTYQVENYSLEYVGPRMEVDNTKRMVFADLRVTENGKPRGMATPAKFIYKKMPESPTTEVSMLHSLRDDLYVVVGTVNPVTKLASLQIHINPLVSWIWIGCLVLICGSIVCMWPELVPGESRAWSFARGTAAMAASVSIGVLIAIMPARAFAQGASSMHAGTVHIENDRERDIFAALRCLCGGCARDILSTCACSWADDARAEIRAQLALGMTKDEVVDAYAKAHGTEALSVPPNRGALRAIYAVPLALIVVGGAGMGVSVRRWRKTHGTNGATADASRANAASAAAQAGSVY